MPMLSGPGLYILIAIGKFLLGCLLVVISLPYARKWLQRLTSKTTNSFDGRLIRPVLRTAAPLGYLAAFHWGWSSLVSDWDVLQVERDFDRFIDAGITLIVIVMLVRLANPVLMMVLDTSLRRLGKAEQLALLRGLEPMIRILIWIIGILFFLQSQGVEMGAIYAPWQELVSELVWH